MRQSLVRRRLLCLKSGCQRGAPPIPLAFTEDFFFLFVTEWYSSFLLWTFFWFSFFFTKGSLPLLIFPWAKSFYLWILSSARLRNDMKNEPQDERLPRKFPKGICLGPRLWQLLDFLTFIRKYVFLNNSGAFKDFGIFFFANVRLTVWVKFSQIKGKSIFFGLWGWVLVRLVS